MKKNRLQSILLTTILFFIGIILVACIFKALIQPIKTDNAWINEEKTKNFFDIRQLLIWLFISVLWGLFQEGRKKRA